MPLICAVIALMALVSSGVVLFLVPGESSATWSCSAPCLVTPTAFWKLFRLAAFGCDR